MKGKMMREVRTISTDETIEVGKAIGRILKKGDIVLITGDLGTGKTVLTNGIANSLGIKEHITSPTFTIVNEYDIEVPLFHFDVYRITHYEEMFEIGFEEYLYKDGIIIIEWAEIIKEVLPEENIWVTIKKDLHNGMDHRLIQIEFNGLKYKDYNKKFGLGEEV